jgi:hypothetical protein
MKLKIFSKTLMQIIKFKYNKKVKVKQGIYNNGRINKKYKIYMQINKLIIKVKIMIYMNNLILK